MRLCWLAAPRHLRLAVRGLMCAAGLAGSMVVLAQPVAPDSGHGATGLIQLQGQQKQRLMQGQAATELSQGQVKDLASKSMSTPVSTPAPTPPSKPGVAPEAPPASSPQLVTEADVLRQRAQRIERLNAAKVDPAVKP